MPLDPLAVIKGGPALADVKLEAGPVVYVLDGGSSMRASFDATRVMVGNSIVSLGDKQKFTVLLCREDEDKFLSADYQAGGTSGQAATAEFLKLLAPAGATDIPRALKAALARKPKAIVLLARKVVDDAMELAAGAKQQGTVINTISVNGDAEIDKSMKALAEATGGKSRAFLTGDY
jgi:hypothetical protein